MNFEKLIASIQTANNYLQQNAVNAINIHITLRNWLIGFYIITFEQNGEDRATYEAKLLPELAKKIHIKGLSAPKLSRCRQFLPILGTVSQKFKHLLPEVILGSLTQELEAAIPATISPEFSAINKQKNEEYFKQIFSKISYSHFTELIKIKEDKKRWNSQANKLLPHL